MSFYRAPFRDFVREQLDHRVDFLARGRGSEGRPLKWYQQYLTKQAFVRVAPLVKIKSFGDDPPPGFPEGGSTLFMKNFVLEGTPLVWRRDREGGTSDGKILKQWFERVPQFPTGEGLKKGGSNLALLNNYDLRTNPDDDGFGIVPPPGVVSFGIDTKSFYGNLREAKLSIRCFSIKQFEWIEKLYARPGHHVTIEWGWSHYIDNETGKIQQQGDLVTDAGNEIFWAEKASAGKIYRELESRKKERSGNYDGFLGIIKNFQSKMDTDGGFTIDVQLIGRGDLMYSLKLDEAGDVPAMDYRTINDFLRDDNASILSAQQLRDLGIPNSPLGYEAFVDSNEIKESKTLLSKYSASGKDTNLVNLSHFLMVYSIEKIASNSKGLLTANVANFVAALSKASSNETLVYYNKKTEQTLRNAYWFGFLTPKPNIDVVSLADMSQKNYRTEVDAEVIDKPNRTQSNLEVGLGGFVRLGYLLKLLNHFCINQDGNLNPMLSVNNLLYDKDFDPSFSKPIEENVMSIYPSCYSEFPTEKNSAYIKEFTNRIIEAIDQGVDGSIAISDYIEGAREYSNSVFSTPGTEIGDEAEKIFLSPPLNTQVENIGSLFNSFLNSTQFNSIIELVRYSTENMGSCQPSKILFPHQFHDSKPFQLRGRNTPNPVELGRSYNLRLLNKVSNNLVGAPWKSTFDTARINLGEYSTSDSIESNDLDSGLSGHSFLDSIGLMYGLDQIPKNDYRVLVYAITKNRKALLTGISSSETQQLTNLYNSGAVDCKTLFNKLQTTTNGKFNPKRVIDNILINTHWLSKYAEGNAESLTLGNFLEEICKQINTASGGATDLKIIDNPVFSNQISIVDFNINSTALKEEKQFSFPKTGHTSIYKSISLTGKIPDAQASTIAIGAQGPRDAANVEAVTYKAFLEDVEDRISNGGSSSKQRILNANKRKSKKSNKKTINFLKNCLDMTALYMALQIDAGSTKKDWFNKLEGRAKSAMARMNKDITYLAQTDYKGDSVDPNSTSLPVTSIIPLKISIGMEGVSGILASNTFKLDKGILPQKYNQSRVSYMVSKEKQIVKGGVWETSIEGTLVLDDGVTTVITKTPNIAQAKKNKVSKLQANTNPVGDARLYESFEDEFGFVEIPGTYNDNNKNPIELVWIDSGFVKKELALPYLKMKKAAKSQGIKLFVVSGFRPPYESIKYKDGDKTYEASSQDYLYQSWLAQDAGKTSYVYNGTDPRYQGKTITLGSFFLAASPGRSNHGNGIALDIKTGGDSEGRYLNEAFNENFQTRLETYEWLIKNSWKFGFVRTVSTEEWHYDYRTDVAANGPYAVLSAEDLGKTTTKFYNKTKQGTHKGLDELQAPDWGSTISGSLAFTPTVAPIYPFPNRTEGNKFRGWINDNKTVEEIAAIFTDSKFGGDTTLGRSGSSSNIYVKRAWEVWGVEYAATLSP